MLYIRLLTLSVLHICDFVPFGLYTLLSHGHHGFTHSLFVFEPFLIYRNVHFLMSKYICYGDMMDWYFKKLKKLVNKE